jgi:hypothetical protein
MKAMSLKYQKMTEALADLVNTDHCCGCDQDSCDISAAYSHGFSLWAIYLFDSSGAASDEFKSIFRKLPKRFDKDAELERKEFINSVAHDACPECNAVIWHDGSHGETIHCDSCLNVFTPNKENE